MSVRFGLGGELNGHGLRVHMDHLLYHVRMLDSRMEANLLDWCDKCGNSYMMPACIQSLQVGDDGRQTKGAHPSMSALTFS